MTERLYDYGIESFPKQELIEIGLIETRFVWIIIAYDPAHGFTRRRNNPIATGCILGTVLPAIEKLLKIFAQTAGIVRRHVLVGIPMVAYELFIGFHSDTMAL